ncbi:MAG: hypothetical protein R8K20_03865 [Gallionellaceae bacterium]
MRTLKIFAFTLLALFCATAIADVEMKIVTKGGSVAFTVGDDWPVISMQSKLPIAAAGFQIPNLADEGTPESTSLAFMLYDLSAERGRTVFEAPIKLYGSAVPKIEHYGEWAVYRQEALQGATRYTIIDAKRSNIADVSVSARLAWPHLESNPKTYDSHMESVFRAFLGSVRGALWLYTPRPNEVIRHDAKPFSREGLRKSAPPLTFTLDCS